jgi:hypothetical protein
MFGPPETLDFLYLRPHDLSASDRRRAALVIDVPDGTQRAIECSKSRTSGSSVPFSGRRTLREIDNECSRGDLASTRSTGAPRPARSRRHPGGNPAKLTRHEDIEVLRNGDRLSAEARDGDRSDDTDLAKLSIGSRSSLAFWIL